MKRKFSVVICIVVFALGAWGLTPLALGQATWTQLSPTGGPPAGTYAVAASFDQANDRMMVFGGIIGPDVGAPPLSNDVWVLSSADGLGGAPAWTELAPTGTRPSPREDATTVYDPNTNSLILFAGNPHEGYSCSAVNDTWILTNANGLGGTPAWVQLSPVGGPPGPRRGHSAVYDAVNNRMIIFGGDDVCGTNYNDVWVLENANGTGGTPTWIQLSPAGGGPPNSLSGNHAVYDPATNRMTIYAELTTPPPPPNQAWVLENANGLGGTPTWVQLNPSGGPPPFRCGSSEVSDPATNVLTLFGGGGCSPALNDTWVLSNASALGGPAAWTQLSPAGTPPAPRALHSAVLNTATKVMTIFGGTGPGGIFNDVWTLSNANGIELAAQVQQPINPDGSSVFSVKRGVVPVKFTLTLNGTPTCSLPPATISLSRTAGSAVGSIDESVYLSPSDTGSNFRIDTTSCQYVYNLGTSSLGTGTYKVNISIGGSVVGSGIFGLE